MLIGLCLGSVAVAWLLSRRTHLARWIGSDCTAVVAAGLDIGAAFIRLRIVVALLFLGRVLPLLAALGLLQKQTRELEIVPGVRR